MLLGILAASTASQQPAPAGALDSGAAVRFHFLDGGRQEGRLVAPFSPDSGVYRYCLLNVPVQRCAARFRLERRVSTVAQVEVGIRSRGLRGFVTGTTICTGMTIFVSPFTQLSESPGAPTPGEVIVRGTLLSTLTCGALGALVGQRVPRWSTEPPLRGRRPIRRRGVVQRAVCRPGRRGRRDPGLGPVAARCALV